MPVRSCKGDAKPTGLQRTRGCFPGSTAKSGGPEAFFSIQSDLRLSGSSVIRSRSNMGLLEPIPTLLVTDGPPRILLV